MFFAIVSTVIIVFKKIISVTIQSIIYSFYVLHNKTSLKSLVVQCLTCLTHSGLAVRNEFVYD